MNTKITITSEDTTITLIGMQDIIFEHDMENNFAASIEGNKINRVTLRGIIDNENKEETLKLLKWSLNSSPTEVYREVVITISDTEDNTLRTYELNKAFIMDYREYIGKDNKDEESSEHLNYELIISQMKKNSSYINVYAV